MLKERYEELSRTGAKLEPEERRAGWHYCVEFDYDLIKGDHSGKGTKCCWCDFDGRKVSVPDETSNSP